MGSGLAAFGLVACVLALGHQLLSPSRQQQVNTRLRRTWLRLRARTLRLWQVLHGWRNRRAARHAAAQAIARAAHRAAERSGNVIKPDVFNKTQGARKPHKPH